VITNLPDLGLSVRDALSRAGGEPAARPADGIA
jgi:hypothetical protein